MKNLSIGNRSKTKGRRWTNTAAMILLPFLLAGVFVWALSDSDDHLDRLQAAVVNNDEPVVIDGETIPLGRAIAAELVEGEANEQFEWVLVQQEEGETGLRKGRYAAVFTIPEDFSAAATSTAGNDPATAHKAVVSVEFSPSNNLADSALGRQITLAAAEAVSRQVRESYLDNVYLGFESTRTQVEQVAASAGELAQGAADLSAGAAQAADGTQELHSGLSELEEGGRQLSVATRSLSEGAGATRTGAAELSAGAGSLSQGASSLSAGTSQLSAATEGLASGTEQIAGGVGSLADGLDILRASSSQLPDAAEQLTGSAATLTEGANRLATGAKQTAQGAKAAAQGTAQLSAGLSDYAAQMATFVAAAESGVDPSLLLPQLQALGDAATQLASKSAEVAAGVAEVSAAVDSLATGSAELNEGAQTLSEGVSQLSAAVPQLVVGIDSAADGALRLTSSSSELAQGSVEIADAAQSVSAGAGTVAKGASALAEAGRSMSSGTKQLAEGAGKTAEGASGLASGIASATAGAKEVADGASEVAEGASTLDTGSQQLADAVATGADGIPSYSDSGAAALAAVAAQPIELENGGTTLFDDSMPVFFVAIALWLGVLAVFVVRPALPRSILTSSRSSTALVLRAFAPAAGLAIGQAFLLSTVLGVALRPGAGDLAAATGVSILAAISFVAVNQALVALWGRPGLLISAVMVAVTAATGIVGTSSGVLIAVSSALPSTAALSLLKSAVSGVSTQWDDFALLVFWLLGGLVVTLLTVARKRTLDIHGLKALETRQY